MAVLRPVGGLILSSLLNDKYRLCPLSRRCHLCLQLYLNCTSLKACVLVSTPVNDTALYRTAWIDVPGMSTLPGNKRLGLGCRPSAGKVVEVVGTAEVVVDVVVVGAVVDVVDVVVVGVVVVVVVGGRW